METPDFIKEKPQPKRRKLDEPLGPSHNPMVKPRKHKFTNKYRRPIKIEGTRRKLFFNPLMTSTPVRYLQAPTPPTITQKRESLKPDTPVPQCRSNKIENSLISTDMSTSMMDCDTSMVSERPDSPSQPYPVGTQAPMLPCLDESESDSDLVNHTMVDDKNEPLEDPFDSDSESDSTDSGASFNSTDLEVGFMKLTQKVERTLGPTCRCRDSLQRVCGPCREAHFYREGECKLQFRIQSLIHRFDHTKHPAGTCPICKQSHSPKTI